MHSCRNETNSHLFDHRILPLYLLSFHACQIIAHRAFDRWKEISGDPILTAAMVDRLTHKAYLVNMNSDSFRMKEIQKWIKNKRIKRAYR